jgi:hypothetical protein
MGVEGADNVSGSGWPERMIASEAKKSMDSAGVFDDF